MAQQKEVTKRYIKVASILTSMFPDLDLRFSLRSDDSLVRYKVASVSSKIYEMDISQASPEELVHQAIFTVKELTKHFDA